MESSSRVDASTPATHCRERSGQAQFVLPAGVKWQGLKLRATLEVKGMSYPVRWACKQKLNDDGSLTLKANMRS